MKLILNGENTEINSEKLTDLLTELSFDAPFYAVAINDQVIPRSEHADTKLNDGDRIEIIHAVGGG